MKLPLFYRLFGWWIRWQSCKMAAQVFQSMGAGSGSEGIAPRIWSVTVYFEQYILEGSAGTRDDFGPKDAVELKFVETTMDKP